MSCGGKHQQTLKRFAWMHVEASSFLIKTWWNCCWWREIWGGNHLFTSQLNDVTQRIKLLPFSFCQIFVSNNQVCSGQRHSVALLLISVFSVTSFILVPQLFSIIIQSCMYFVLFFPYHVIHNHWADCCFPFSFSFPSNKCGLWLLLPWVRISPLV